MTEENYFHIGKERKLIPSVEDRGSREPCSLEFFQREVLREDESVCEYEPLKIQHGIL